jgi:hypothetical protein
MVENEDYKSEYLYAGISDYEIGFDYDVVGSLLVEYEDPFGDTFEKEIGVDYEVVTTGAVSYVRPKIDFGVDGKIAIYRNMPLTQTYNGIDGRESGPSAVMAALDRIVWMVQQVFGKIRGAISAPRNEDVDMTLPPAASRANGTLGFDFEGDLLISSGSASVNISTAMTPVVQAATLAAARTAMSVSEASHDHDADYAPVADYDVVDTDSGDVTATTPTSPVNGQIWTVVNSGSSGNHVTGLPGTISLGDGKTIDFRYDSTNTTWRYQDVIIDEYEDTDTTNMTANYTKWAGGRMTIRLYQDNATSNQTYNFLETFNATPVSTTAPEYTGDGRTAQIDRLTTTLIETECRNDSGSTSTIPRFSIIEGRWKA